MPETVALELDAGRLLRADTIDARTLDWVRLTRVVRSEIEGLPSNRLGRGERAVIAYARAHPTCNVGLDDRQARLFAQQPYNFHHYQTVGWVERL